jgi:KDO2-lipid IV(A) lauroyltransferase
MDIFNPISIDKKKDDELSIGKKINEKIEEMILKNPGQWIWTHNRWKV